MLPRHCPGTLNISHLLYSCQAISRICDNVQHTKRSYGLITTHKGYFHFIYHTLCTPLEVVLPYHQGIFVCHTILLYPPRFTTATASFDPSLHLTMADISLSPTNSPTTVTLHIKVSKTDPFRRRCYLHLFRNNSIACPVTALCRYLHMCSKIKINSSALFVLPDKNRKWYIYPNKHENWKNSELHF